MKKIALLALFLFLTVLVLSSCSPQSAKKNQSQATPAITPIVNEGSNAPMGHAEAINDTAAGPSVIIAGAGLASSQRKPIRLQVPLTPLPPVSHPTTASNPSPPPAATPAASEQKTDSASTKASPTPHRGVPVSLDDTLNILVIGSDERNSKQPWRADVIMLVAIDYANRQIGIISFPRDLWVTIPTVGENRINTATFFGKLNNYPNGGDIGLLKDTLAQNFGLRIDHYIKFNFNTFRDIIDAMDGIDIVVQKPLTGYFPVAPGSKKLEWKTLQPGKYHMDGELALRYVRERKTTSDVDRNRRQQQVLVAMRKRAREVNIIPRIPALYDAMRDNIVTDLGLTDIIALTRLGLQIDMSDIHGFNIGYKEATSWTTPGGAAVLRPNMAKIQEGINSLFTDKPTLEENSSK